MKKQLGFTLIEMLVVIGIIGILAAIVLIAVNPGRQFAQARDTQRRSDLFSITNAIYQFAVDNNGNLPGVITAIPQNIGKTTGCDLSDTGAEPLVPLYIAGIPFDPSTGDDNDTDYVIFLDANGRVVASASGEITPNITVLR